MAQGGVPSRASRLGCETFAFRAFGASIMHELNMLEENNRQLPMAMRQPVRTSSWTFRETATTLFRRKWLLLGVFLSIAAVTVLLALFLPNKYQSRMKILVKNARADVVISPERTNATDVRSEVTETQINSE